jgi:hypothetical protein
MPQIRSVAVSLPIATQALDAQVYWHPIIGSGERSFRSIALAPPTADMIPRGFRRSDFKEKEAEQLAAALAGVVSSAMKKRGWAVDVNSLAGPALQDKDELRWLVGTLRSRHQSIHTVEVRANFSPRHLSSPRTETMSRMSIERPASLQPRRFTYSGIRISPGHLRVASTPIFEP